MPVSGLLLSFSAKIVDQKYISKIRFRHSAGLEEAGAPCIPVKTLSKCFSQGKYFLVVSPE